MKVHATLVKRGVAVAHCSSEDVHPDRLLELPLWMLDSAVCGNLRVARPGNANVESLRELKHQLHLIQSASGGLAREAEHQYLLKAGGAGVHVAASQAFRATPAVCLPKLEATDESVLDGSVNRCSAEDGALARTTPPALLHPSPWRRSGPGGGR